MDYEGIKTLLTRAEEVFPRLSHVWLDGGYRGEDKGADWVQTTLGWSAELVERPRKPAPKEVLMAWAREWAKEGIALDWQKLMPAQGFVVLPRRWVVERTFSWIDKNRRMSKDYERLPESGEAFIYVAMSPLMLRRMARSWGFSDGFRRWILGNSYAASCIEPPWRLGKTSFSDPPESAADHNI
jgi:putative transposase